MCWEIHILYNMLNSGIKDINVLLLYKESITGCLSKGWNLSNNQVYIEYSLNFDMLGLFDKLDIEDAQFNKRNMCHWLRKTHWYIWYMEKWHQDIRCILHN